MSLSSTFAMYRKYRLTFATPSNTTPINFITLQSYLSCYKNIANALGATMINGWLTPSSDLITMNKTVHPVLNYQKHPSRSLRRRVLTFFIRNTLLTIAPLQMYSTSACNQAQQTRPTILQLPRGVPRHLVYVWPAAEELYGMVRCDREVYLYLQATWYANLKRCFESWFGIQAFRVHVNLWLLPPLEWHKSYSMWICTHVPQNYRSFSPSRCPKPAELADTCTLRIYAYANVQFLAD